MANAACFPDCPAHDVKVRVLFDEFDCRKARGIDLEAMLISFKKLNIAFSTATTNDLFEKADTNGDGIISFGEWQRFGEMYPTLLDCLYYRAKDFWTDIQQKEDIEATKRLLEDLKEKEGIARRAHAQAQADTDEAERQLQCQLQALADAQQRELEAKTALDAAHQNTERARSELRDRVAELNKAKDRERQRQLALGEAQREVEAAIRRLQAQEQEVAKAHDRLRDLERMLNEQQREVERQLCGAERLRAEVAAAEGREEEAHRAAVEALREVHAAADSVAAAEDQVAACVEKEKHAAGALRDAAEDTARHLAGRDALQQGLLAAKDEEAQKAAAAAAAAKAVDDQEHCVIQQQHDNEDFRMKRKQVDEEELPLIEQEVRLREQRENLERKECKLRSDFTAFAVRSPHQRLPGAESPVPCPSACSPREASLPVAPSPAPGAQPSPCRARLASCSPVRPPRYASESPLRQPPLSICGPNIAPPIIASSPISTSDSLGYCSPDVVKGELMSMKARRYAEMASRSGSLTRPCY